MATPPTQNPPLSSDDATPKIAAKIATAALKLLSTLHPPLQKRTGAPFMLQPLLDAAFAPVNTLTPFKIAECQLAELPSLNLADLTPAPELDASSTDEQQVARTRLHTVILFVLSRQADQSADIIALRTGRVLAVACLRSRASVSAWFVQSHGFSAPKFKNNAAEPLTQVLVLPEAVKPLPKLCEISEQWGSGKAQAQLKSMETLPLTEPDETSPHLPPGIFEFFANFNNQPPISLKDKVGAEFADYLREVEKQEPTIIGWCKDFNTIPLEDRVGRAAKLIPSILLLGSALKADLSITLRGGLALHLFLREGLFDQLVDPLSRQRLFSSRITFIAAFVKEFRLGDSRGRISRLLKSAELWLLLLEADLPLPPNLSRIEDLLPLGLDLAVVEYGLLAQANSGKAPAYTAIQDRIAVLAPEEKSAPSRRDPVWLVELDDEAQVLAQWIEEAELDRDQLRQRVAKLVTLILAERKRAQDKLKPKAAKRDGPLGDCPLRLVLHGKILHLQMGSANDLLIEAIGLRARRYLWKRQPNGDWHRKLSAGRSKAHAQEAETVEWLTRLCEKNGVAGPKIKVAV